MSVSDYMINQSHSIDILFLLFIFCFDNTMNRYLCSAGVTKRITQRHHTAPLMFERFNYPMATKSCYRFIIFDF